MPPGRRVNRALVIGLAAGALVLLLLIVAAIVLTGSRRSSGHALMDTLQFRKVLAVTSGTCPAGTPDRLSSADSCYQLGDGMTVSRVAGIALRPPGQDSAGYSVDISLQPDDASRLTTLTSAVAHEQPPRNQLAIVKKGRVGSAPSVLEPITGGKISLSGNLTRAEAQSYVDLLGD